jgi:hypothetical protein
MFIEFPKIFGKKILARISLTNNNVKKEGFCSGCCGVICGNNNTSVLRTKLRGDFKLHVSLILVLNLVFVSIFYVFYKINKMQRDPLWKTLSIHSR